MPSPDCMFIGKGACINCHNGPLSTNNGVQNVAIPVAEGLTLYEGRYRGAQQIVQSEFNVWASTAMPENMIVPDCALPSCRVMRLLVPSRCQPCLRLPIRLPIDIQVTMRLWTSSLGSMTGFRWC